MKKLYLRRTCLVLLIFLPMAYHACAQCAAGSSTATLNWDNLDYLTQSGNYSGFITNAMLQSQKFAIGRNRVTIDIPIATITTNGENFINTAETGSYGVGADVEYNGNGLITITFDTVVSNLQFSLYDIDNLQTVRVTAFDGLGPVPLLINMTSVASGVVTIAGNGGINPTATSNNTSLLNNDTRGTLNISIAGNNPIGANGVKRVIINMGYGSGVPGNFWLSDLNACVYGSFPNNYYVSQQPWIGQPAYYLVTPDNNSVYLFNPLTGKADWLFSEPASPWVNSMAYDHVNHYLYYVMDHSSPVSSNRSLKRYDFNTETISTIVADVTTLGIPLYDIVVESAGAAYYNGSLFLGIEGTNSAKNSSRESIIWRIDFDAAQNPVKACQVFARQADDGLGMLMHDWGDFTIKDGVLYDFNTGNVGSTSQFIHFNMQSGIEAIYNTNGNPAPIQAGQTWDGKIYWTGGQGSETGRVALYNENGTIGAKIIATVTPCSPPWVGRAGDASDPFRPKSDFGDAPASYDPLPTNKATHEFLCNLRLGATFDKEWDKTSSPTATADGADEDGISAVSILAPGITTFVQNIKVFNNTGASATLIGWLDYNGDGFFGAGEGRSIVVVSNAAMQTVTLAWNSISVPLTFGATTFLRLRLAPLTNNMTINHSTGWFPSGEVEDYRVSVQVILPVDLLSFNADLKTNNQVALSWKTSKEINFKGFDVERSNDAMQWDTIGFVNAIGNGSALNNYTFNDADAIPGINYYRLKLLGTDGSFKYSHVRSVTINDRNTGVIITPNPVDKHANLKFNSVSAETITVSVINSSGVTVMHRSYRTEQGQNNIQIDKLDALPAGVYVVRLERTSGIMNIKMMIQRH
ncbi:MAG TPA: T9SS type A sorting domain-containing protein [Chitinophagaceae bacterium]|nr:T9SS type A sorting domain-containing protein [Chitinophagaceae bacterium]